MKRLFYLNILCIFVHNTNSHQCLECLKRAKTNNNLLIMRKIFCAFILIFFVSISSYSTPQMPDILVHNGIKYDLGKFYLESYFEKNPDKKNFIKSEFISTALWRGYVATFEIDNNQLFLTDLEVETHDEDHRLAMKSIFSEVFPDSKRVKLDYFNGVLWGGANKQQKLYSLDYDNYCIFEIKDGNIVKEKQLIAKEYKQFKKQQINAFEQSNQYKECVQQLKENHSKQSKDLAQFAQDLGEVEEAKYYRSTKFTDKEAREIIRYNIFDFISEFVE